MKKCISICLLLVLTLTSCENSTKNKLLEFRNSIKIVDADLEKAFDSNVKRNINDGIEYGLITLQNSETIKYWFQSHHTSEDKIGGTLFEMPDGKLEFIEGYFCCEVQLPNDGKFKNAKQFIEIMKTKDGIRP